MRRLVFFALAGVVLLTSGLFATDAAAVCLIKSVTGVSPTRQVPPYPESTALSAAIQNWYWMCTHTTTLDSPKCNYSQAKDKKTACKRVPHPTSKNIYTCTVVARPCWLHFSSN